MSVRLSEDAIVIPASDYRGFDVPTALARPERIQGNAEAVNNCLVTTAMEAGGIDRASGLIRKLYSLYTPWMREFRKHRKLRGEPLPLAFVQLTEAFERALHAITPGAEDAYRDVCVLLSARVIVARVLLMAELLRVRS